MNDDQIDDLKQFMTAVISQQTADLREDIQRLDQKIDDRINELSLAIGDALNESNRTTDKQLKDHERRITKLEHKTA
ncbi:MAG TPA: hypothetical protein VFL85_03865 [Candidatus Saccharimonadales bacterium]|nr:hypothetical protein [Candidatus Saccharimonadales bacterium]